MRLIGASLLVGAYVCPRGVVAIRCRRAKDGIEIEDTLEAQAAIDNPQEAADHLIALLRGAGIRRAELAMTLRGFGVVHHILQMPPASDDMLSPIIDRELRRLEPQLGNASVSWIPLPSLESARPETGPQRSVLGAAVPREVAETLEKRLGAAGYRLGHLTALPASMQRLLEEFESTADSTALVVPLPDGAFLGFCLSGGLRLVVEPPPPPSAEHEVAALAEELELGSMFVRQQFHGSHIDRVEIVGTSSSLGDAASALAERVHLETRQFAIDDLSAGGVAALGAVLDSESARPLALGGSSRRRVERAARTKLETSSLVAVLVMMLVGLWTLTETVRTRRTADAVQTTRRRIEQDAFGLAPLRSTAGQRKLVQDAVAAVRLGVMDRAQLQETLAGIAGVASGRARLDTLRLARGTAGWVAVVGGSVQGTTNARAVETLHELYRELPERLPVDSLRLDQLTYSDSTDGSAVVRFRLSFGVRPAQRR